MYLLKIAALAIGISTFTQMAVAQQKIGHINSEELITAMPEMKAAETSLQSLQKKKQTELEQMEAELQRKIKTYEDKYRTISVANKEVVEKELKALSVEAEDLKKRLELHAQKAEQELQAEQERLFAPILKKAENAIKLIAKERGYAYVLDAAQPGLVYMSSDDLSALVKAKLGIQAATN